MDCAATKATFQIEKGNAMSGVKCLLLLMVLLTATATEAKPVYNFKENLYRAAPPNEVRALPKFCWGRYNSKLQGPTYNINRGQCGPGVNHYCQGLLRFNRAMNPLVSKNERKGWLNLAAGNIEYTLKAISKYPSCPIAKHVKYMHRRAQAERSVP